MKLIFLDIDGPLLSHRARQLEENDRAWCSLNVPPLPEPLERRMVAVREGADRIRKFDPIAVALILKLLNGHSARIVISSSWQKAGKRNIEFIFQENGISPTYLHSRWRTDYPKLGATRAQQIRYWLDQYSSEGEVVSAYAAIDDDPSVLSLEGGVLTPYSDGFRWCDFCSASTALGGGFVITNLSDEDDGLSADVSPGALGEAVYHSHGNRPRRFNFGPIGYDQGPAPLGCLRLFDSHYQLVRLGEVSSPLLTSSH